MVCVSFMCRGIHGYKCVSLYVCVCACVFVCVCGYMCVCFVFVVCVMPVRGVWISVIIMGVCVCYFCYFISITALPSEVIICIDDVCIF